MKILKKMLKWTSVVILSMLVLLVLINAFDEKVAPEVDQLVSAPLATVPQNENAYFALFGFQAPPGEDIHARGVEIVAEYEKLLQADPNIQNIPSVDNLLGEKLLRFVGNEKDLCRSSTDPDRCMEYYLGRSADTTRMLVDNKLMLDRYLQLTGYSHFQETLPPVVATPMVHITPMRQAHQIFLAKIAMSVKNGAVSDAIAMIGKDTSFLRQFAAESTTLIGKLSAFSLLSADMRALSEIVTLRKLASADIATVDTILQPLTDQERSLALAIRCEARYNKNLQLLIAREGNVSFLQMPSDREKSGDSGFMGIMDKLLYRLFFKPIASFNIDGRLLIDVIKLDSLKATDSLARLKERSALIADLKRPRFGRLDMVYNPVGKINAGGVAGIYSYIGRGHNLVGLMRLIALKLLIKEKALPDDQLEQLVKTAGPRYADPYTDGPMQWDAQKRNIYFNGMNRDLELKQRVEISL